MNDLYIAKQRYIRRMTDGITGNGINFLVSEDADTIGEDFETAFLDIHDIDMENEKLLDRTFQRCLDLETEMTEVAKRNAFRLNFY